MDTKRTILIAEDSIVNRKILSRLLDADYDIITAENGKIALEKLAEKGQSVSAIILDLTMPVMDGFEVLKAIQMNEAYQNIPVVVATGSADDANETKALALGAWDFVSKPYNAGIIKFRLRNAIDRSQLNLLQQIRHQAEHDALTGLYNTRKFHQAVRSMLDKHPDDKFVMVRLDVDRFRQFNSLYGTDAGDDFIRYIASLMPKFASQNKRCVYAHIEADVFAICASYTDKEAFIGEIKRAQQLIKQYNMHFDIATAYGLYPIDDKSIPATEMLDRATLAAKSAKGSYLDTITEYDEKMGQAQQREQEITNEMSSALEQEQFCVYYQPKYNIATETPCGAEALVRWRHPKKGLVSPGAFIPVFEKTGFIAKVDYYVWKKTCENLKKWCDAGLNPDPVSVNVSRVNLNNPNIVEMITELVRQYGIEPRLLQLEITETAYMDNPEMMDRVVKKFHEQGFTILMDDFGSGYSSLNTLKEISVDILKVDMKFLPTGESNTKSEKILASVIRMADWLGMPVVVEGVETPAQKNFLQSVGCLYVQGYYYGRPMPVEEYESLISDEMTFVHVESQEADSHEGIDAILSADPKMEALLTGISVPVGIYEYTGGNYDRIRANQSFYDTFGYGKTGDQKVARISDSELKKINNAFAQAAATKSTADSDVLFILSDGSARWFRVSFRYIMSARSSHMICAVFTDISLEKKVETEMSRIVGILNQGAKGKRSMLVVDDSEENRAAVQVLFEQEFNVLQAEDGQEGIDLLNIHKEEIAIILLDMIMPKMDGSEFLAIKNHMSGATEIPVIIISSDQREDSQISMLRSGVNDYITKPFVPEMMYRRVKNVLEYQSRFSSMITEFRKVISLSPAVRQDLNLSYMTLDETRALVTIMNPIFDVVRVVDPSDTAIITIDENNQVHKEPYSCFKVWNKGTRCVNCSSACAMRSGCQMTKYEFIENDIFYVVSRPIEIILNQEESMRVILEIVSHVSDSLMGQEIDGVPVRQIVENTRRKIYCDPLTSAYNRRFLYEMLFLHKGRNNIAHEIAIVMMDMDGFKSINDTHGHAEGDRILAEAARALMMSIRPSDSVVRYGGDEFLIILANCRKDQINKKISSFANAVNAITYGENGQYHAAARFGYSYTDAFQSERGFLEQMIQAADKDMYRHKAQMHQTAVIEKHSFK